MDSFTLLEKDENLEVIIRHNVVVSKVNANKNFRDYLEQIAQEFDREYSKTMYQILMNGTLNKTNPITKKPDSLILGS